MVSNLIFCLVPVLVLMGIRKWRERTWGYCKNSVMLDNKVAVVTGANSGIGYEIVKELALRNATVILACRNVASAKQAVVKIEKQLRKSVKMAVMELDLASLKSIQKFARNVQETYPQIHILVNNAGVSYPRSQYHVTEDGFEIHFGVNHFGHFLLTQLLLDTIKSSAPSRIVIVSSSLHERGVIDADNLQNCMKPGSNLYANSKLANMYFCKELAKRTEGAGVNVYAICPGWVYTSLFRNAVRWYHYILVAPVAFFFMRSPKQGCQTAVFCATEPALEGETGLFYKNCCRYVSKVQFTDDAGSKLWNESERLINEKLAPQ